MIRIGKYSGRLAQRYEGQSGALFQDRPLWGRRSKFAPKGWTDSIKAYLNASKDLTSCILLNRQLMGRPYALFGSLNIEEELTVAQHKALWKKVCDELRCAGVIALWVREPSRTNHVNYHLLIKNPVEKSVITGCFEASIGVPWHHSVEPVRTRLHYAFYITKGKIAGMVGNQWREDKYAAKRLLFMPGTGLRKHGVIGGFWEKRVADMMKEIIETNKRVAAGLKVSGVKELADYAAENLGITRGQATRSLGYWAEEATVQKWIEELRERGELPDEAKQ